MATMNSRASSSSSYEWDVFISFRGADTGTTFTGHLHKALVEKKVNAFMANKNLRPGEAIDTTLKKKIQESRIALVVFSKNYASSVFCLEDLENIMECSRYKGMVVWPIFYEVEPSDMRRQNGSYAEALAQHEEKFEKTKIGRWRAALNDAANLSGLPFKSNGEKYEHEFIDKITQDIIKKISSLCDDDKNQIIYNVNDKHIAQHDKITTKSMKSRASSSSSITSEWMHDVLISFCVDIAHSGFIGNLYKALFGKELVNAFRDEKVLEKGAETSLVKAIQGSRIALVIFSRNYAASTFCLEELAKIMECSKDKGMLVLPVFYHIHPAVVRDQTGIYAKAFAKHEARNYEMLKLERWKFALRNAAVQPGLHFRPDEYEDELIIENIIQSISEKISGLLDGDKNQGAESVPEISNMKPNTHSGSNPPYIIRTSDGQIQIHHINCPSQQSKPQSSRSKNRGGENLPDKRVHSNKSSSFTSEVFVNGGGGGYYQGAYTHQCMDCMMNQQMAVWINTIQPMMHGQPPNMAVNYMYDPYTYAPFPPPGP